MVSKRKPGDILVDVRYGLIFQLVHVEYEVVSGKSLVRYFITKPSTRLSTVVLRPANPIDEEDLIITWRKAKLLCFSMERRKMSKFEDYVEEFLIEDLGCNVVSISNYQLTGVNYDYHKYYLSLFENDYINYEASNTSVYRFTDELKMQWLGACLYKEIAAKNDESSHYRTYIAIKTIMLSNKYTVLSLWIDSMHTKWDCD